MSNNGAEFTPEQIEHQIDMLAQSQEPWPGASPDAHLISELYQIYTEADATVENAWQRLVEQKKINGHRSDTGDTTFQYCSRMDMLPERQERPQRMKIITEKRPPNKLVRLLEVCAAILVVATLVVGTSMLIGNVHQNQTPGLSHTGNNVAPTATQTLAATILFSDPLNMNIHNWPTSSSGPQQYIFKNNAYHLINEGTNSVIAVCQQNFPATSLSYQITMEEITGDDASIANAFGIMLNYHDKTVKGKKEVSFYAFEIVNDGTASQYNFYKYDNRESYPWQLIGKASKAGKEFHSGHGSHAMNVVKVTENANSFTFYINGHQVGTAKDGSLKPGSVGMLVNLKGTEVAFSNMLITRP
ncbi:MAG TPA: hypothetical protein VN729_12080 [Ktedonobacteraceae bacterium]|nr:hypothetical protein [Ktedonobacteraceae bacterium]